MLTRHSQVDLGQTFSGGIGGIGGIGLFRETSISPAVVVAESGNGHCVHAVLFTVPDGKPASYGFIVLEHRYLRRAREVSPFSAEVFEDAPCRRRIPALNGDVLSRLCLQVDGHVDTCRSEYWVLCVLRFLQDVFCLNLNMIELFKTRCNQSVNTHINSYLENNIFEGRNLLVRERTAELSRIPWYTVYCNQWGLVGLFKEGLVAISSWKRTYDQLEEVDFICALNL